MPSQQRFEGSNLEDLLAEVREQYGPDANIVEANRVRTGGIGGFFAREGFEVVVEADTAAEGDYAPRHLIDGEDADGPAEATAGDAHYAPRHLLDLVDAVDDGPAQSAPRSGGQQTVFRSGTRELSQRLPNEPLASESSIRRLLAMTEDAPLPDESTIASPEPGTTEGIAALLTKVEAQRARGTAAPLTPSEPAISTDGEAFADVLARITSATQPSTPTANEPEEDAPFQSYADTLRKAARAHADHAAPSEHTEPSVEVAMDDEAAVATIDDTPAEIAEEGAAQPDAHSSEIVPAPPAAKPAVRGRRNRMPEAEEAADEEPLLDSSRLARLGLPAPLVNRPLLAADRVGALAEIASSFPTADPLPTTGSHVIALVGDRDGMDRAVAWISDYLGLGKDQLAITSKSDDTDRPLTTRIADYDAAEKFRNASSRRSQPVLVIVDQPVGLRGTAWARHVLDILEPSAVWGVVGAHRKPEDVVEWSDRLRGVDAIALDGTDDTSSPAAVVTTGLPVSLIDGLQATPARWAAVLDEHLAAA